ncbi:MAG: hypothetical protein RMJ34_04815 [candidate division WOR-3 bacterium]|nr:hypothetical protein [candidate division WOR-3 bacterium]MDW8114238.1 hypothetical protein [candidate division WOR-3 bacterium]
MKKIFLFLIFTFLLGYQELKISISSYELTTGNRILPSYYTNFSFGNPLTIEKKAVSFSYLFYLVNTHFGGLGFGENKGKSQYGIFLNYFNSGDIKKIDEFGQEYGSYLYSHISLSPFFASKFKNFKIGMLTNLIYSSCDTFYSLGMGVNLLGMNEFNIFRVGYGIKNFNFIFKPFYQTKKIERPEFILEGGVNLTEIIDLPKNNGLSLYTGLAYSPLGLEYHLATELMINNFIIFRLAYLGFKEGLLTRFSSGLEFIKEPITFSYGFLPYKDLGIAHIFNLTFNL